MSSKQPSPQFGSTDSFVRRHIGPDETEIRAMLARISADSLDQLIDETLPSDIRLVRELELDPPLGERQLVEELGRIASGNQVQRSLIGMGYSDCIVPPVIQRNVLENPGWYTQYTPYQAEIAQGRLEALLVFQTMVSDLCGLPLANASLLDEATAAAEALAMCHAALRHRDGHFYVSQDCHPQTIAVVRTRAEASGVPVVVADLESNSLEGCLAALVQYPTSSGRVMDYAAFAERVHAAGGLLVVATDLLALTLLRPPGEFGADVAVGSSQRFGVPMGFGGPHAAFLATSEKHRRLVPGRLIGVSRDARGEPALRMALQTREQHIRRDKATSNICTAQVLLAVMAGMYAVWHGPQGLREIARGIHARVQRLCAALRDLGYRLGEGPVFDTLVVEEGPRAGSELVSAARAAGFNLRAFENGRVGIALDETTTDEDLVELLGAIADGSAQLPQTADATYSAPHARSSSFLEHPVFHEHRTEHEMLRYLWRLQSRDLSLTHSMIPLGSCTMKLNATTEMLPVTWPEFANVHPFAPFEQTRGYRDLIERLERQLCEITGFAAISLQPNAGSQGEYSGLLTIRAWHHARGDQTRDICLIPVSAHGTNPASAVLAGMKVVPVACDDEGNVDVLDLRAKAVQHADRLAALMVTYPSTHGVFETAIREICSIVHEHGGRVYLDGANMNAQVGLCRPGDYGADVCHLNLHKTFCIPHGGGGPGMGPIGVTEELAPFLPSHPVVAMGGEQAFGTIAAAPWGSPSILPISWAYVAMMGAAGLKLASEVAILNANYMAARLEEHFTLLYRGHRGRCAHEFIVDLRPFEKSADVVAEDVAKRLMDYGFHAPTVSFPVAGTLMIEPTESETKAEIDRYCDALIAIRAEVAAIEEGKLDRVDNPLKNAPHPLEVVTANDWEHGYSRETAAWPADWLRGHKFWPAVARIDNGYGDRHLVCSCPPMEDYAEMEAQTPEAAAAVRS